MWKGWRPASGNGCLLHHPAKLQNINGMARETGKCKTQRGAGEGWTVRIQRDGNKHRAPKQPLRSCFFLLKVREKRQTRKKGRRERETEKERDGGK